MLVVQSKMIHYNVDVEVKVQNMSAIVTTMVFANDSESIDVDPDEVDGIHIDDLEVDNQRAFINYWHEQGIDIIAKFRTEARRVVKANSSIFLNEAKKINL